MNSSCDDFAHFTDPRSAAGTEERKMWESHLQGCARCRRQDAADRALRTALATGPNLEFSEGFDASLRRRLFAGRPRWSLGPAARTLLAGYGVAAAGLSTWILGEIAWPSALAPAAAGLVVVLTVLAAPLLLLPRSSPFAPPS